MAQIKKDPRQDQARRNPEPDEAVSRRPQPEPVTHYPEAPEEHDEQEAGEGAPINEDIVKQS